jgi:hypothetical protein
MARLDSILFLLVGGYPVKINWRVLIGIAFSLLSLALILYTVDLSKVGVELAKANYWWVVAGAGANFFGLWAKGVRWRALLDNRVSISRSFWISNVGNLLNNVLPLRIGELSRAYMVSRNSTVTTMQGLSTVLIERLLDVLTVFGMMVLAIPFVPGGGPIVQAGIGLAVIAFTGVVGLFIAAAIRTQALAIARFLFRPLPERLREALLKQGDEFLLGVQAAGGRRLATGILWSLLTWLGWGGAAYLMLIAFIPNASLVMGLFVNGALAIGLSIPSAPSGAGLYEAGAVLGLSVFGISSETALAYAIVAHIQSFVMTGILGTIGLDREGESLGHLSAAAQNVMASARGK